MNNNKDQVANNNFAILADMFGAIFNVVSFYWKFVDYMKSLIVTTEDRGSTAIDTDIVVASEKVQCSLTDDQSTQNEEYCDIQRETKFTLDKCQSANHTGVIKKIKKGISSSTEATAPTHSIESFQSNVKIRFHDQPHLEEIVHEIIDGLKVMIIMRGAPGCGKSYLAQEIIDATTCDDYMNHIFSSDSFFYDDCGRYNFSVDRVSQAHEWNKNQVDSFALQGWSPIIIDNMNVIAWEMQHYLAIAVRYGYLVKIVEPQTPWSKSADELTIRNGHNVTKEVIKRMLLNYEYVTVERAMERFELKYTMQMPQYRVNPPLSFRKKWKERVQFQKVNYKWNEATASVLPFPLFRTKIRKHRVNCENENKSFAEIRQIYPSVSLDFLWNLFVKCKGNGDWTMDILLNDERQSYGYENLDCIGDGANDFVCNCETSGLKNTRITTTNAMMDSTFKIGDEHYSEPYDKHFNACAIDPQQNENATFEFNQGIDRVCQSDSESNFSQERCFYMFDETNPSKEDVFEMEFAWPSKKTKVADWISNIPQHLPMADNDRCDIFPNVGSDTLIVTDNEFAEAAKRENYCEHSEELGGEVVTSATNDFHLCPTTSYKKLASAEAMNSNLKLYGKESYARGLINVVRSQPKLNCSKAEDSKVPTVR